MVQLGQRMVSGVPCALAHVTQELSSQAGYQSPARTPRPAVGTPGISSW